LIRALPINPLSLRERAGVRGSNTGRRLNVYALILSFSRREKGHPVPVWQQISCFNGSTLQRRTIIHALAVAADPG